ncbi:MAG TPA: MFS transporter [Candidatus Binatia bacterium]|nr:MFS transporter [Candidatus Binatia bacterium]
MLLSEHARPTAVHWRILALTGAGWTFDFYDLILYTFLLAPISAELGLSREAHAVLLGASLGATAAGGAAFGWLADRHGRKAVLQWSILTYSVGTALSGLAPGAGTLLVGRLVTGLGVGGEWAIGHALVGESVPARLRGRFGALLQTGAPIGVGLAALVGSFVAPVIGWRATFVLSACPALLVTAIRRGLPESDLWLRQRAPTPPVRALLTPRLRRLAALAFGLTVLNMSSYWFTYVWLPTYLTAERGLTVAASGLRILVVVCGELLGYASFGLVSDRFGRKPAFTAYATIMAAGLLSITLLWRRIEACPPLLLVCLWLVGFGTGTWSNFGPMFGELFPTALRTTAVGTIFNAARGVQLVTPLAVAVIARRWGLEGGIALAAGFALAAAGWVWLLPETRGRRIEA